MGNFQPVEWLKACAAAFQFLTRIPVRLQLDYDEALFRRSAVFYPLVGAVIGLLLLIAAKLLGAALPPAASAVLLVGGWLAVTGGLHMDGLMDTADGLLSHRSRERMLEIMKDSRVGAMGVMGGGWMLLLKAALLYSLLADSVHPEALDYLAIVPIWSRLFLVYAIAGWPYAREGEGLGRLFAAVSTREAALATILAVVLTLALFNPLQMGVGTALLHLLTTAALTAIIGILAARWMAAKLGGLTGDTYGALNELLEAALLLGAVAWGFYMQ
ncbi:adenosylcobinamide-GDP ribazoletransferase [Paenibacillus koleovorans]|uniref:adenosylcobinamide-GDP ribazoletransferase n=1 Tax=Paenibacillus koleovorans TaxID=121608 RepID=UPI000FD8441C|nr:adenosylcobinamide-GDP ribazoletransferase [Paenibacillus koleovorans]